MPIKVTNPATVGGSSLENPFVGPVNHTVAIPIPLTPMTTGEVDEFGYLKPGVPVTRAGAKITVGVAVYGVTVEAIKVAKDNVAATLAAAGSPEIAVALVGTVNRAIIEDNLGRALTADEIAGFALAGSLIKLIA